MSGAVIIIITRNDQGPESEADWQVLTPLGDPTPEEVEQAMDALEREASEERK